MSANKIPFCIDFYLKSRKYSNDEDILPSDIGINWIKPFPRLEKVFNSFNKSIFSENKTIFYTRPGGDIKDRELLAELLNIYLGNTIFRFEDVVLTNSSSEALEIYFDYISHNRIDITLPLPCYFKYDLLALRKKVNIYAYYNIYGDLKKREISNNKVCLLINNPEAVSGKFQDVSFYEKIMSQIKKPDYYLYDFCYLMLDISKKGNTHEFIEKITSQPALQKSTFTLTPSKDISIASFRAGILVSKDKDLIDFAKNKILERYFTLNIISTYSMILYLIFIIIDKYRDISLYSKSKEIKNLLKNYNYDSKFFNENFIDDFIGYHQKEVISSIKDNFFYMREYKNLFDFFDYDIPEAGFSTLWKLNTDLPKKNKIIQIAQDMALTKRVNIYPAYYNGGNEKVWQELYPNDFLIRVNSSLPKDIIIKQFDVLDKTFNR